MCDGCLKTRNSLRSVLVRGMIRGADGSGDKLSRGEVL